MLPTFICIGAQKAATTWLYSQLCQHPEVFLPERKELNFFYRKLAITEYEWHFRNAQGSQARGDISPNYMVLPGVAERMYAVVPNVRLLCILRQPTERAKSQYQMAVELGNIPRDIPFIEAFRKNLQYIRERGCYTELLERFTCFYPKDQLLVALYDDLVSGPIEFLKRIQRHIGVDENFLSQSYAERIFAGVAELDLTFKDESEARDYYAPHVEKLENFLGRHLKTWR